MFFKSSAQQKPAAAPTTQINSLIGVGSEIHGNISFSAGLRIEGVVRGNVTLQENQSGLLVVGEQGRILGDVHVSHLIIDGEIEGSVYTSELLQIGDTGKVRGDMQYGYLEVQPGAMIQGQLRKLQVETKVAPDPVKETAKESVKETQSEVMPAGLALEG